MCTLIFYYLYKININYLISVATDTGKNKLLVQYVLVYMLNENILAVKSMKANQKQNCN